MKMHEIFEGIKYPLITTDDYGKNIVFDGGGYKVAVNKVDNASYITVWKEKKGQLVKCGVLDTHIITQTINGERGEYVNIDYIQIDKADRGKGLGRLLYKIQLDHSPQTVKGIISYLPNRSNKRQVPRIYKSLGSFLDGDYEIIPRENLN